MNRLPKPKLKPFSVMTDREKASHLVHDHGLDADYFSPGLIDVLETNQDVVEAFIKCETSPDYRLSLSVAAEGHSYPWGLKNWHDADHDEGDEFVAEDLQHTHSPDSPLLHVP